MARTKTFWDIVSNFTLPYQCVLSTLEKRQSWDAPQRSKSHLKDGERAPYDLLTQVYTEVTCSRILSVPILQMATLRIRSLWSRPLIEQAQRALQQLFTVRTGLRGIFATYTGYATLKSDTSCEVLFGDKSLQPRGEPLGQKCGECRHYSSTIHSNPDYRVQYTAETSILDAISNFLISNRGSTTPSPASGPKPGT
jgi:hypothetical protein